MVQRTKKKAPPLRCTSCNAVVSTTQRFCSSCGAAVLPVAAVPAAAPPVAVGAGPSLQVGTQRADALEEQRKIVTVLFADLSGSTPLGEKLDPEELRSILGGYFRQLAREIQRFGGTVDKYIGDAVMAVFGAPVSHDDDPERAVHAALAMLGAIQAENEALERKYGVRLSLRIGVNTGEVVAGLLAGDVQGAYTVVGDAVNTAQRFESVAPLNTVLVSESTYRLARRAFLFETLPPVTLKGKSEPVPAYRAIARERRAAPREGPSIVGRGPELNALHDRYREAIAGSAPVVHLHGDAGIGKTRLVQQFLSGHGSDVARLRGRCTSYETGTPYALVADVIRRAFRIAVADDEPTARAALQPGLQELASGMEEGALALMLEVLGYGARSSLGPEQKRGVIVSFLRSLLRHRGAAKPVILEAEDIQWIDTASAAVIADLATTAPPLPALLITTARDATSSTWPATMLAVGPLDVAGAGELVDRLVGDALGPDVRALIVERTGGNPFFIEEVVRAMQSARATTVPATIQDALEARLDGLDPATRSVAQRASVIGRTFWLRVLARIAPEDQLGPGLATLERETFIAPRESTPERTYQFRQSLLQEVAYHTQLLTHRRRIHAAVGRTIEELFADRLDEFVDVLALHYGRSDDHERARTYLLRAGLRAQRLFAKDEALAYLRTAIERSEDDATTRTAANEAIGDVQRLAGAYADALEAYGAATTDVAASDTAAHARLRRKIGVIHILRGDLPAALATFEAALAELPPEAGGERAHVLIETGQIRWREGRFEDAIALLEAAVGQALGAGDDGARADALKQLGTVHVVRGDKVQGLVHYRGSLELYETLGDLVGQGNVLNNMGLAHQRLGQYDDALAAHAKALAIRERIGDVLGAAQSRNNRAEIYRARGQLDQAEADYRTALDLWQTIGYASVGLARSSLGITAVEKGDPVGAREHLFQALRELERAGNKTYLLDTQRHLARAHLPDDPAAALEWARRSLEAARELGSREREGLALQALGVVLEARGEVSDAIAALESAREILQATGERHELARTLVPLSRLYRVSDDGPRRAEADGLLAEARAIFSELGAALDLHKLSDP